MVLRYSSFPSLTVRIQMHPDVPNVLIVPRSEPGAIIVVSIDIVGHIARSAWDFDIGPDGYYFPCQPFACFPVFYFNILSYF